MYFWGFFQKVHLGVPSGILSRDPVKNSFWRFVQELYLSITSGVPAEELSENSCWAFLQKLFPGDFSKKAFWGFFQEFHLSVALRMPSGDFFRGLDTSGILSGDTSTKTFCEFLLIPSWIHSEDSFNIMWKHL